MLKEPYHNYATYECTHVICKRLINGTFSVWLLRRRCGVSELGLALLLAMGKFGSYLEPLFVVSVERSCGLLSFTLWLCIYHSLSSLSTSKIGLPCPGAMALKGKNLVGVVP
jgi:hypothetical protein